MTWIEPIARGWVVRGEVPGPDVDEFADPVAITGALATGIGGLLAVQHPQRTPAALAKGATLDEALPAAREALHALRDEHYDEVSNVVALYQVDGPDASACGLLCLVDPAAVDVDGTLRVRHSEEVYPAVVAERAAALAGLGCATSAAMLVPVTDGDVLTEAVTAAIGRAGSPAVQAKDAAGRAHRLWLLGPGGERQALLELAGRRPLLVADGNHRVAAASGTGKLLALITGGPDLRIGAFHRVLAGTGKTLADLERAWRAAGLTVDPAGEPRPGVVVARAGDGAIEVVLPVPDGPGPHIDHATVERVLLADALGLDPEGDHVRPIPAGADPGPDADALLMLAPVSLAELLAVHAAGRTMPRKCTYFQPKPRSGLLLADLHL
ncbi:DUF1015 family protein [Labedaea rhizosphaerae]|uniref:Uncharacterized protein (DUF1015 family) n=1 Tax=Labedaea rhizosphaerae TaxID=598644 RepID=A0A4R6RUL8_LABRH|nr:DUF1015 family protein [Labedaea rhizosphaerae]TDP90494.1 uncharacterized protein (DUF1015 family) [Labedaea rhizosphaerae]